MDTFNKPPCPCAVERDFWAPTKERERGFSQFGKKRGRRHAVCHSRSHSLFSTDHFSLFRPIFFQPPLVWCVCVGRALLLSLSCGVKWLLLPPSGPGDIPYLAHLFRLTPSDDCPTRNRKNIYIYNIRDSS